MKCISKHSTARPSNSPQRPGSQLSKDRINTRRILGCPPTPGQSWIISLLVTYFRSSELQRDPGYGAQAPAEPWRGTVLPLFYHLPRFLLYTQVRAQPDRTLLYGFCGQIDRSTSYVYLHTYACIDPSTNIF